MLTEKLAHFSRSPHLLAGSFKLPECIGDSTGATGDLRLASAAVPNAIIAKLIRLTGGRDPRAPTDWSASYIGILAFMAVISTALCWWLWITLLDSVPAWEASLSVLGTPVVA